MNLSRHFNLLMASALSVSLATTPLMGVSFANAQNAPAAEAPGDSGWQKEFDVWRSASKGGKAADYESYLRAYPTGKFASVAKKRIDELNAPATADTTKVDNQKTADTAQADTTTQVRSADTDDEKKRDLEMWRQVSKTGTQADYEKYLKAFPKGKFAKVAKTRIDALVAKAKEPVEQQAAETKVKPAQQDDTQSAADSQQDQSATDDQQTDQADSQDDNQAVTQDQAQADDSQGQKMDKAQAPSGDWEQEYALWKAASDGNTVKEYEAYLKAYPAGKFSAIAQARIVQLAAAEQPVANVPEGDDSQNDQQNSKVTAQTQADDQGQADDQNQNDQAQDQSDQNQADDQQMANSQDDSSQQNNDMGQNTQDQQQIQYTEGTPDTEDQYLDREARHEIQGRLTSLGYDTAGTDGSFGPRSRNAISAWQQDNGAPVTSYLSGDQIAQIRKMSQVVYVQWQNAHPVVVEQPVVVRPRREKVIIEERNPGVDAAIAVGVLGAVVGAHRMKRVKVFAPGRVKVIGKIKFGGCKKRRRC